MHVNILRYHISSFPLIMRHFGYKDLSYKVLYFFYEVISF